ncbi:hypothetical protein I4U23_013646 [Adineta vaga]|nr:hypothetical protein I4U23_013646 [Adineta vaga]
MDYNHQLIAIFLFLNIQNVIDTKACSIMKISTADELIQQAYAIVRVTAVKYEKAPDNLDIWSNSMPTSIIRFEVEEIIKGDTLIPNRLFIEGYLTQNDDFNDHSSPYNFVRPNGRMGSCFAMKYKQNGNFLLFLNQQYSPYWSALAPVNEQLYSPPLADPWLQWIKSRLTSTTDGYKS